MSDDRPPFVDPNTEWVECWVCGRLLTDLSRVEGIDLSDDDEYYPDMAPVCPKHANDGGDDE